MSRLFSKTPFLRLLIPAVSAIVAAAYLPFSPKPLFLFGFGIIICVISFLLSKRQQYKYRWLFGSAVFILIFALFSYLYQQKKEVTDFTFSDNTEFYTGIVQDLPQEKPRSFACEVKIKHPLQKKIVLYLQKNEQAAELMPGQEIVFQTKVQPFKNFGNPDDFDYSRFMQNKGFSGTAYATGSDWISTGKTVTSLRTIALKVRQKALKLYEEFQLDHDSYSFVSALTLGYKQDLSDELKEAFRASGTSHVLAVSGLHVGIVYIVIVFLFSFFSKKGKMLILQQLLIIAALWMYALLTGMSPSVIRATIMLTIVTVGVAVNKKGLTYNTLAATAFLLLAFNPMYLFDVGFQMSFGAVLSILFFNPKINRLYIPKNKIREYVWGLFTVSTSAQLGVFPISLYYFGSFPTYFFIANMIIVPLIGLIIYATLPLIILVLLKNSSFLLIGHLFTFFQWILRTLVNIVLKTVYRIESIPFAQLSANQITLPQMILITVFIVSLFIFLEKKRAGQLIVSLLSVFLLLTAFIIEKANTEPDKLVIFNTPNASDISIYSNNKRIYHPFEQNGFLPVKNKRVMLLSENNYIHHKAEKKLNIDILILSQDRSFSINNLLELFEFKYVVFDNTVPQSVKNRWIKESLELNITPHDVSQHGAFVINL